MAFTVRKPAESLEEQVNRGIGEVDIDRSINKYPGQERHYNVPAEDYPDVMGLLPDALGPTWQAGAKGLLNGGTSQLLHLAQAAGPPAQAAGMTPQEQFLYDMHRRNLAAGGVRNEDASTSTIYNITTEIDGKHYVLPTIWPDINGVPQRLTPDRAIARAQEVGIDRFPSYASEKEAEAAYSRIHDVMARDMPAAPAAAPEDPANILRRNFLKRLEQEKRNAVRATGASAPLPPVNPLEAAPNRQVPDLTNFGRSDYTTRNLSQQISIGETQTEIEKIDAEIRRLQSLRSRAGAAPK